MHTTTLDILTRAPIPTWFRVGGHADRLVRPRNADQLRAALELDPDARILGDGANLLVDDPGVRRLVIDLAHLNEHTTSIDHITGRVHAPAGARLPALINRTVRHGLAGLETLAGIPASVGGAVMMNAGGAFGSISDSLTRVLALNRRGHAVSLRRDEIDFNYRHSGLDDLIITAAEFQLTPTDRDSLTTRRDRCMAYKNATQPLSERSAGCAFRNPVLDRDIDGIGERGARVSAGLLIDRAGCKGLRLASASVSTRHANFIIAMPGGRAGDVLGLLERIELRVREAFGITLQREIVIWSRDA
jgi:UDP-N-acetylmuramate dehydrogenase